MSTLHIITPIIALLLIINIKAYECSRILDEEEEHWMKTDNLVLQSLQKGAVRPPGNGCKSTPQQGGNRCTYEINQKGFAGHVMAPPPPPPPQAYPQLMGSFGVATNQVPK